MLYNKITKDKIKAGAKNQIKDEDKWITPIVYDGKPLNYTVKNSLVVIDDIEENTYGKKFVVISAEPFKDAVNEAYLAVKNISNSELMSPFLPNGSFRAIIDMKTTVGSTDSKKKYTIDSLIGKKFTALVSISIPTFYTDSSKSTLQVRLKDLIVHEIEEELEYDYNKLTTI
jgi:hypothetical protein